MSSRNQLCHPIPETLDANESRDRSAQIAVAQPCGLRTRKTAAARTRDHECPGTTRRLSAAAAASCGTCHMDVTPDVGETGRGLRTGARSGARATARPVVRAGPPAPPVCVDAPASVDDVSVRADEVTLPGLAQVSTTPPTAPPKNREATSLARSLTDCVIAEA